MPARPADLWLMPHRPLFLAAALWAIVAVVWWQWGEPPALGPFWHGHEMLAGFGGAALAAYLLTALPSWTGAPAPSGAVLQAICACWLLQRLAMARADSLAPWLLLLPGLGFFGLVAAVMLRAVLRAQRPERLGLALTPAALGLADALAVLAARVGWDRPGAGVLLDTVVLGFSLLIAAVGGRMVPAFTDSWRRRGARAMPPPAASPRAERLGRALLALALALTLAGARASAGPVLVAAGLVQLWRLAGWRGRHVLANPLLAMLHAAYLWLPLGLMLAGAARLMPDALPATDVLHALGMGAMGGMILAVAARAAARRGSGYLRAGPLLAAAGLLVWLAPWLRLAVIPWPAAREALVPAAALLWCAGWGLFLLALLPTVLGPPLRPVFSSRRR